MNGYNNIRRKTKLTNVYVSKNELGELVHVYELEDKKVELDSQVKKAYEDAVNPDVPLGVRVKRFLTARNKHGKYAKTIKDAALIFLPWGNTVGSVTELISKQIERTMPQQEKNKSRSRTIITFGLIFIAGILMQLNIIPADLSLSPDAQWVMIGTSVVGVLLRLITGKPVKVGPALDRVIGLLRDAD